MALNKILKSRIWPAAWQVFVRIYAMLLLPLLGWGVDDLPGFFSYQVRMAFAIIVLLQALIGAWLVYIMPPQPKWDPPFDLTHWQIDMYHVIVHTDENCAFSNNWKRKESRDFNSAL
jgi:hypothetical protein